MSQATPALTGASLALLTHRKPLALSRQRVFVLCKVAHESVCNEQERAVSIVVALDRSGSMNGAKIQAAISTLRALVHELGPMDRFALVTFDDVVEVLVEPMAMTSSSKEAVRSRLSTIAARGSTDLGAALLKSLSVARAAGSEPWHVIVLSDGAPTAGLTDTSALVKVAEGAMGDCTLSTFGYGNDVQSELLGKLSDCGKGHYHFVKGDEPPIEAFASELGRQRALLAVEVGLRLKPGSGVTVASVPLFTRSKTLADGVVELDLPNLTEGDTVTAIVGLKLGAEALAANLAQPWLEARLQYRDVGDGLLREETTTLVPVLAEKDGPYQAEVARELAIHRASELIHRAASMKPEDLLQDRSWLVDMASRAGVDVDPQVRGALALLEHTIAALRDNAMRPQAVVEAAAMSRGVYHREVTSVLQSGYQSRRTFVVAERMKTNLGIGEHPPKPPPKPGTKD